MVWRLFCDIWIFFGVYSIKGQKEYIYNGERTREEMLPFAVRMSGPPVQPVTRVESFDMLKSQNDIFFTYVGPQDGVLWETFYGAADRFQPHMYFYATTDPVAKKHFLVDSVPTVLVYKERNHFFFPCMYKHKQIIKWHATTTKWSLLILLTVADAHLAMEPAYLNETLHQWISEERFMIFPKITRTNLAQLSQTKKYLVVAVVEENKLSEIASHELEFRDLVESIIRHNYDKYHSKFQFGWIGSPEMAHSIVMDQLPTPHLIVLNSTTYEHHLPDDDPLQLTTDAIHMFLQNVHHQKAPVSTCQLYFRLHSVDGILFCFQVLGGTSIGVRFYRMYFEAKRYMFGMWRGNPVLTCLLFGLPAGFLALILYTNCCGDFMVVDDDEEEERGINWSTRIVSYQIHN